MSFLKTKRQADTEKRLLLVRDTFYTNVIATRRSITGNISSLRDTQWTRGNGAMRSIWDFLGFSTKVQQKSINGDKVILDLDGYIGSSRDGFLQCSLDTDRQGAIQIGEKLKTLFHHKLLPSGLWRIRNQNKFFNSKKVRWGS